MDIDHFSDFARGSSETHQKLSEPIFVRGLPWRILAMPREQNRVRFPYFSLKFEYTILLQTIRKNRKMGRKFSVILGDKCEIVAVSK